MCTKGEPTRFHSVIEISDVNSGGYIKQKKLNIKNRNGKLDGFLCVFWGGSFIHSVKISDTVVEEGAILSLFTYECKKVNSGKIYFFTNHSARKSVDLINRPHR